MQIIYAKEFLTRFKRLSEYKKESTREIIRLFQDHPFDPSLHNHPLSGSMTGKRSISVTDDMRIIFTEKGGHIEVLMLDIGTHDTVYHD